MQQVVLQVIDLTQPA